MQHYLVWNWRTGDTSPLPGLNRVPGDPMISPNGRTLYVMEQNVDGEIWMLTLDRGERRGLSPDTNGIHISMVGPTWTRTRDQRIMSPLATFVVTGVLRNTFVFDVHGVR